MKIKRSLVSRCWVHILVSIFTIKVFQPIWKFTIFTPKCWEKVILHLKSNILFCYSAYLSFSYLLYACLHMTTSHSASVENKRRNLWKSVLSLPCRSQESNPGHHQVGCKHLYPPDQLTDPILCLHIILFVCKIYLFLFHACGCLSVCLCTIHIQYPRTLSISLQPSHIFVFNRVSLYSPGLSGTGYSDLPAYASIHPQYQ